jgi:CBS domain-containing protein
MKGITLFIFGGVAEMSDEPPNPKTEFLMAIAGPVSSLVISGIFFGLSAMGRSLAWPVPLVGVFHYLYVINLLLVAFNMIPGFPLDGGRVLRSALWAWKGDLRTATRAAAKVGEVFGFVLIALGVLQFIRGDFIGGLWWLMIGIFIRYAAKQGYNQVVIRQALRGEAVSRFMNPSPVTVGPAITVQDLVDNYIYKYHYKMFPVVADGNLLGCVSTRQVRNLPPQRWAQTHVGEIITANSCDNTVSPDEDAMVALSLMNRTQASRLLVVDHGRLMGILALKDLLKFLNLKMELEGPDEDLPLRKAG